MRRFRFSRRIIFGVMAGMDGRVCVGVCVLAGHAVRGVPVHGRPRLNLSALSVCWAGHLVAIVVVAVHGVDGADGWSTTIGSVWMRGSGMCRVRGAGS